MLCINVRRVLPFLAVVVVYLGLNPSRVLGQQDSTFQVLGGAPPAGGDVVPLPSEAQTPEQIFQFLDGLGEMEPAGKSEEEIIAHQKKIFRTVEQAVAKVLTMELTDPQAQEANFYKLQALQYLQQLGEPGAGEKFQAAIAAAMADPRPVVSEIGLKFHIEQGLSSWPKLNDQQKAALIDTVVAFVSRGKPDEAKLQMIMAVVDFVGDMRGGEVYAKRLLDATIPLYKSSGNEDLISIVPMLEGIARRMALPGHPIEISGTLLDGSQFDWAAYRGKVVLVDFWATWCGPCRAEVPNVLKLYKAYHDKGFDVVGISLDEKPEQAQSYITQTGIPWVTLFNQDETQRGWEHPLAVYYGITGIPRAILVDQAGNVVSMRARGKNLEVELRKLLGEPLASADEPQVESEKSADAKEVEVAKPVVSE